MTQPNTYCAYVSELDADNVHKTYHDSQYGFPIDSDDELFGRLILEINQAGLSWTTILNKAEGFRRAYAHFDIQKIAEFSQNDINRLMHDKEIIRNKRKILATIYNAQKIRQIQQSHTSFHNWLLSHHPQSLEEWVKLFRKTFKFTGGEITKEFLRSSGYIPGAHEKTCPIFKNILKSKPIWLSETKNE